MAILSYTFVVLVCITITANALKCYDCEKPPCIDGQNSTWTPVECPKPLGDITAACLTQVLSIPNNPNRVVKKCVNIPQGKTTYQCNDPPGEKTIQCDSCMTDLCNSAGYTTSSTTAFAGIIMLFLVSKFLIH